MKPHAPLLVTLGVSVLAGLAAAQAPCQPSWLPTFGGSPGLNGPVLASTIFDDGSGSGPALCIGGLFTSAGGTEALGVATWDGTKWSALGSGVSGSGSPFVLDLTVFDDGNGPALYAAGSFTSAGGVAASHIAKWDGSSWSPLGSGTDDWVYALTVFDDGSGNGAGALCRRELHERRRSRDEPHRQVGWAELVLRGRRDERNRLGLDGIRRRHGERVCPVRRRGVHVRGRGHGRRHRQVGRAELVGPGEQRDERPRLRPDGLRRWARRLARALRRGGLHRSRRPCGEQHSQMEWSQLVRRGERDERSDRRAGGLRRRWRRRVRPVRGR